MIAWEYHYTLESIDSWQSSTAFVRSELFMHVAFIYFFFSDLLFAYIEKGMFMQVLKFGGRKMIEKDGIVLIVRAWKFLDKRMHSSQGRVKKTHIDKPYII